MIDCIEKLLQLINTGDDRIKDHLDTLMDAIVYIRKLEEDKARIEWLSDMDQMTGHVRLPNECVINNLHSLRSAIDDAMLL